MGIIRTYNIPNLVTMRKILLSIGLIAAGLAFLANPVRASEGTLELTSTKGQAMRCYVFSNLVKNYEYQISLSCRDLIYPPKPDAFSYILWAAPTKGDKPLNLGELGIGKEIFKTKIAFSKLFVTIESDIRARAPEGETVMEGAIQAIPFLDKSEEISKPGEVVKVTPTVTPTPARSTSSARNILGKILGTGAILLGVVFVIVLVVYFLSRRRFR